MLTMRRPQTRTAAPPDSIERRLSSINAGTIALISILALAAFFTLDRALAVQHASATAIGLTNQERMLSQRIASLTAQYIIGNNAARRELRGPIDALESTQRELGAADRNAGVLSAIAGGELAPASIDDRESLDTATTSYVARARHISALSPRDRSMPAQTAALLFAANGPLIEQLDRAIRIRQDRAEREFTLLRILGAAFCAGIFATLLTAAVTVFRPMARRIVKLTRDADELSLHATVDPLTGMLNGRSFQARGAIEIQKARRYQRPLSLLVIDADHLPAIAGTYGTDGGETLLKALTSSFFAGTRITDLVARVNAEQFAILLPETNCEGAQLLAERLRRKISDLSVPIDDTVVSCTVSIGVAAAEKDASFLWPTFKRADEALYEAKQRGRNRVVVANAA